MCRSRCNNFYANNNETNEKVPRIFPGRNSFAIFFLSVNVYSFSISIGSNDRMHVSEHQSTGFFCQPFFHVLDGAFVLRKIPAKISFLYFQKNVSNINPMFTHFYDAELRHSEVFSENVCVDWMNHGWMNGWRMMEWILLLQRFNNKKNETVKKNLVVFHFIFLFIHNLSRDRACSKRICESMMDSVRINAKQLCVARVCAYCLSKH